MTKSISSIINPSFINSFTGLAKGDSTSQDLARALSGQGATKVTIRQGLRLGAQAFGTAVQNLNSLISFVNVSRNTLQDVEQITDKMIELAEKATKGSTGVSDRKKLVGEFEDLARDFQKILDKAKIGERELLKQGDIEELFITLGLDPSKSEVVAEVFEKFLTFDSDQELAYPSKGNSEVLKIPASAFVGPQTRLEIGSFTQTKITDSAPDEAYNYGAASTLVLSGSDLTYTGFTTINNVDELWGVTPSGQYSVFESQDDILGSNSSNYRQLFLADNVGNVISQLTTNSSATLTYHAADISSDGRNWAYVARDGADEWVVHGSNSGDLADVGDHVFTNIQTDNTTLDFEDVKISSDGSHLVYREVDGSGDARISFRDTATNTRNNTLYNQTNINIEFDFIDTDKLAIARELGDKYNVISYTHGSSSTLLTNNLDSITNFTTIEKSYTFDSNYYFAFHDNSNYQVNLYRENAGLVGRHETSGDTPQNLSLTTSVILGSESATIEYHGNLGEDVDDELYNLYSTGTQEITQSTRLAPATNSVGDILNSATKLLRKPDAYRLLHDLKGLKEQISTNLKALEDTAQLIEDNIQLVRSTGLAFLELSDQISDSDEADAVARLLRAEIRKAPIRALAQAENLQSVAVAALTVDPEEAN